MKQGPRNMRKRSGGIDPFFMMIGGALLLIVLLVTVRL